MLSTDKQTNRQTNKQTDRQTDKLTNATKNTTSFAKEVIKVKGHRHWWLPGGYDLEMEHF